MAVINTTQSYRDDPQRRRTLTTKLNQLKRRTLSALRACKAVLGNEKVPEENVRRILWEYYSAQTDLNLLSDKPQCYVWPEELLEPMKNGSN